MQRIQVHSTRYRTTKQNGNINSMYDIKNIIKQCSTLAAAALSIALLAGCYTKHDIKTDNTVEVKPIEVKPMHITVDINLRIERELEDFFSDIDEHEDAK